MALTISELTKSLNLTDEQLEKMESVQSNFDTAYTADFESQRNAMDNKNKELLEKLAKSKDKQIPDDFDADGYKDYIANKSQIEEDQRKLDEDKLIATQNWDKLKNEMTNSHDKTLKKETGRLQKDNDALRHALDSELIENIALKEIDKVDGSQTLLMPHIKDSIKTYQDDSGMFKTKVVDSSGSDRINAETGNPMSVKELVSEFQANDLFSGAFPIQNKGSNTNINTGGGTHNATNNPFDKKGSSYSLTEQAKLRKTNPVLAKSLQDAIR